MLKLAAKPEIMQFSRANVEQKSQDVCKLLKEAEQNATKIVVNPHTSELRDVSLDLAVTVISLLNLIGHENIFKILQRNS